jgi:NTE family protein
VNAVVLAAGLAEGGRAAARERLERVWRRISRATAVPAIASVALDLSTRFLSPYQLNPLGLKPLRDILGEEVDFERLRTASPVRLLIATTRVRDGRLRLFRDGEVTLDTVLALTCLPLLHHAVSIDGEWYWDGGYTANPPLTHLAAASEAADVILVQLTPTAYDGRPTPSPQIVKRLQQIAFNSPLLKEIEALATLQELSEREGLFSSRFGRKLQRLRLHRIAAEDAFEGLDQASALNLDWSFLTRLRDSGRAAAEAWLAAREARLEHPVVAA